MHIKSITFDYPVFNCHKIAIIEEVHAPELNHYINSAAFGREHCYFITVEVNNEQYIIDNNAKKKRQKEVSSNNLNILSKALNSTVHFIEVTFSEESNTYELNTLCTASPYTNPLIKEIVDEYPNLLFNTNTILMEYSAYMNIKLPSYAEKREYYLVTMDYKDTKFVISKYRSIHSANNYLHKVAIKRDNINLIKVIINEDSLFSVVTDNL